MFRRSMATMLLAILSACTPSEGGDGALSRAEDLRAGCESIVGSVATCRRGDRLFREVADARGVVAMIPPDPQRRRVVQPAKVSGVVSWEVTQFAPDTDLQGVCMRDERVGYAVGGTSSNVGVIYQTRDGGQHWTRVASSARMPWPYGCAVVGTDRVVVVGFENSAVTSGGLLMSSHDGGKTWSQPETLYAPDGSRPWLNEISFGTSTEGLITSLSGTSFRTDSGGGQPGDWQAVTPGQSWWKDFTFLADGRIWLAGVGVVFSDNFGRTWRELPRASPVFDGAIDIDADGFGFTASGSIAPKVEGWVYRTRDGGQSWSPQPVLGATFPVRAVKLLGGTGVVAAGGDYFSSVGAIWSTQSSGDTWVLEVQSTEEFVDVAVARHAAGSRVFVAGGHELWRRDFPL